MTPHGVVSALTAVLLLLSGVLSALGQGVQKPQLVPDLGQTVLQPGDRLRVTCQADRPVTWNLTSLDQDFAERHSIVRDTASGGDYSYASHLEIRDVSYLDVGYQRCEYVGVSDPGQAASVYLYVNDTQHLLVSQSRSTTVILRQNQRGVIPCRPSHPGVEVKLTPLSRFPPAQEPASSPAFVWDPRLGFVLASVQMSLSFSRYMCVAGDQPHNRVRVFVIVTAATESVSQPNIDKSDALRSAVLGGNFSLECSVHPEPAQSLEFEWEVPAASTGLKTGRIRQQPGRKTSDGLSVSRLLVTDARPEDNGDYTCRVRNHNDLTNSRTVSVTVHNEARVQVSPGRRFYRAGARHQLSCTATGYPTPTLEWRFEPCDQSQACAEQEEGNMTLSNAETETQVASEPFLVQSTLNVTAARSGVYWCYANNSLSEVPAEGRVRFFVSDIAGGFGIERRNDSVISGDTIRLSCGGSRLQFDGPGSLHWRWAATEYGQQVPVTDLAGVKVLNRTTRYSYRRVLVLAPALLEHAGWLSCTGTDVHGGRQIAETRLAVTGF